MKPWFLPSGLQHGIPFIIQDDWSPEQALAVVELLREQRCSHTSSVPARIDETDPPF